MERAVRSPRTESAMITDRARSGAFGPRKALNPPGLLNRIGRRNPVAGNGIFGCRDGRLKSASETAGVTRDGKSGTIPPKIPTETAYPEGTSGSAVWEDWMVGVIG